MSTAHGDFDADLYEMLERAGKRLRDSGMDEREVEDLLVDAFTTGVNDSASSLARALIDAAPVMLAEHQERRQDYERRIHGQWGTALDRFYSIVVAAEEAGSGFDRRWTDGHRQPDHRFEALTGLHARACRTAMEVHRLLSGGYPQGALARCRTLHELAVIAEVLNVHGHPDGENPDLAQRYLRHHAVLNWNDAQTYQENSALTEYEPIEDVEMATLKANRDRLVAHYGAHYGKPYGWAAPLHRSGSPTFRDLEALADVSHLRSHYRLASHEVHADAKGDALNIFEVGGKRFRSTGMRDTGLATPGHLALISLSQSLLSLLLSADPVSPSDVLTCAALGRLVADAGEEFSKAEASVAAFYEAAAIESSDTSSVTLG